MGIRQPSKKKPWTHDLWLKTCLVFLNLSLGLIAWSRQRLKQHNSEAKLSHLNVFTTVICKNLSLCVKLK